MSDSLATVLASANTWFEQGHAAGWLDDQDRARFAAIERRTPTDLFVDAPRRPLVVALFGGTGVGKSSLLNRLAGSAIAAVGVERPTSRTVTVYVHESVRLADLPDELPVNALSVQRHAADGQRELLWIDAPDIDSTEAANRQKALAWLPHVDLVCYVVSPERYRDDVGWRVLRQRGHRHGWMFVLNRWDEGDPAQLEDFARMLRTAGFRDPLLLATCCAGARRLPTPDQFDQIQRHLAELLQAHGVQELTRLGHRVRLEELRRAVQAAQTRLGSKQEWTGLAESTRDTWLAVSAKIAAGAEWSIRAVAGRFAAAGAPAWVQLRRLLGQSSLADRTENGAEHTAADIVVLDQLTGQLWDDWSQGKLVAVADAIEINTHERNLSARPLRSKLDALVESAGAHVAESLRDHVRAALGWPGTTLTRLLRRLTGFLMTFLPCVALAWVAYGVIRNYHAGVQGRAPFGGVPFLVDSAVLVLVAWLMPFLADRALRPSLEKAVRRALRAGLAAGLGRLGAELEQTLTAVVDDAQEQRRRGDAVLAAIAGSMGEAAPPSEGIVARVTREPAAGAAATGATADRGSARRVTE